MKLRKPVTMRQIRRRFPQPVSTHVVQDSPLYMDSYCIGGAVCHMAGLLSIRFPHRLYFRDALLTLNPTLPFDEAQSYADAIIVANDSDDFQEAWTLLDKALTRRQL